MMHRGRPSEAVMFLVWNICQAYLVRFPIECGRRAIQPHHTDLRHGSQCHCYSEGLRRWWPRQSDGCGATQKPEKMGGGVMWVCDLARHWRSTLASHSTILPTSYFCSLLIHCLIASALACPIQLLRPLPYYRRHHACYRRHHAVLQGLQSHRLGLSVSRLLSSSGLR